MSQNNSIFRTDIFTTGGMYLYIWPFVLAMLALIIWGLNMHLGSTAPDFAIALTPYMLPVAGLFTALGIFLYNRFKGKLFIIKKRDGSFFAEIEMPGKEPLKIDPLQIVVFTHHIQAADHGTNSLDRYATFLDKNNNPGFKVLLSGRTFGTLATKGYKKMNEMPPGGCPLFRGNAESIRKFCVSNSLI